MGTPGRCKRSSTGCADMRTGFGEDDLDHYRRELHVHCYRLLASYDEAEDAVQDLSARLAQQGDLRRDPPAGLALQDRHQRVHGRDPGQGTAGAGSAFVRRGRVDDAVPGQAAG